MMETVRHGAVLSTNSPEYLVQLLKDKRQLQTVPGCFVHLERILDEEISRVRGNVLSFSGDSDALELPEPVGPTVTLSEKLTIPVKEHPEFNFVGRLLGPRGMTAKQLEIETGCKILIRGRGSMRDKNKEEQMRGKAKWEHLNEDLHVLITVEDSKNRATIKLKHAAEQVKKLLVPSPENEDELKKRQLMELALLNGTYRGFQGNANNIYAAAVRLNNNNNIVAVNNHNNNNVGLLMMPAGPPFCAAGMPGVMASQPAGGALTALPIILSSDAAGAPVFIAASPQSAMFAQGPLTPLPSPNIHAPPPAGPPVSVAPSTVKSTAMSLPLHAPPPAAAAPHGVFIQHLSTDPSAPASAPVVTDATSPIFDFPMTSPGTEICLQPPPPAHPLHPANMTSYVH